MPTNVAQPKEASTRRQLATIRKVLDEIQLTYEERYDAKAGTSSFDIDADPKLDSVKMIHSPGLLALYGVFGVKPKEARLRQVEHFATLFNRVNESGCVFVRENGQVAYRASVNYSRVKDLEAGYVAGLVGDLMDAMDAIDLPLILIAKGKSAQAAVEQVWTRTKERRL
jgi:hypothetical protein